MHPPKYVKGKNVSFWINNQVIFLTQKKNYLSMYRYIHTNKVYTVVNVTKYMST